MNKGALHPNMLSGVIMHDGMTFPRSFLFASVEEKPIMHRIERPGVAVLDFSNDFFIGGNSGHSTDNYAKHINDLKSNPEIRGLIINMFSGGGMDVAGELLRVTLSNFTKTKPAIINAITIGSAAYLAALGANLIIAPTGLSRVGSIGAYVPLPKWYAEVYSLFFQDVYADNSGDKNAAWRQYTAGELETELYLKSANESANYFIDTVKSNRQYVDPEALTGKMYLAKEAKKMGLIDGIGDMDYLFNRLNSLLRQY